MSSLSRAWPNASSALAEDAFVAGADDVAGVDAGAFESVLSDIVGGSLMFSL